MNRELLEKPFDPNQIRQREGNFGKWQFYWKTVAEKTTKSKGITS